MASTVTDNDRNQGAYGAAMRNGIPESRLLWVDRIILATGAVCVTNAIYLCTATALFTSDPFTVRSSNAWSGIGYLLLGAGLVFSQRRVPVPGVPPAWGPRMAVGAPAALGLLSLGFWVIAALGIYQPGFMPGGTGFMFGLLAAALLTRERWPWVSLVDIMFWLGLIFVIMVWYLYRVGSIAGGAIEASFSPGTLLVFIALILGMLFLHIERGKLQVIALDTPAGQAVRRALVPAIVAPPVLGYIFLEGELVGYYDSTVKTALVASSIVLVFALTIAGTARSLRRLDARRHEAEHELASSRARLAEAQRIGQLGSWEWDPSKDKATWSDEMFLIFGLDPKEPAANYERALKMIHPEDAERFAADVQRAIEGPGNYSSDYRIIRADGQVRYLISRGEVTRNAQGKAVWLVGAVHDVTELKLIEISLRASREEIEVKAAELTRSNSELEQFAYVASHDLQEPLRMVASYVQLIERRYKGKLDEDADDFIRYAVEGANRMQALIQDLLAFSRVGSRGKALIPTEVQEAVEVARQNLEVAIEESGATLKIGKLPPARADPTQLSQLFQNLIGNAIKFQGPAPPIVEVTGKANGTWCEFVVKDNGIGIDPKYFDRIFLIFQRLHGRDEYPGTGIGLAVCRRIVERHGGKIWVESAPGAGSAFHFTIPSAEKGVGG